MVNLEKFHTICPIVGVNPMMKAFINIAIKQISDIIPDKQKPILFTTTPHT
ncbi:hypothetical protein AN1V17_41970 [Vallitalea sediminicola]